MSRYAFRLVGWDVSWTLEVVGPALRPRRAERRFFLAGAADLGADAVAAAECDLRAGVAAEECDLRAGRDRRAAWGVLSRDGDAFFGVGASAYGLSWGGRGKTGY